NTIQILKYYLIQTNKLKKDNLIKNKNSKIEKERTQLANFEKIHLALEQTYYSLHGEQKGLEWLNVAETALQEGADYDSFIREKKEELTDLYFNIEEISFQIRDYKDQIQFNESRLNEVESRLNEIA